MRQIVKDSFLGYTIRHEYVVYCLYADYKNYVSTLIGNLADPKPLAFKFPFKRPDGTLATREEISREWDIVKNAGLAKIGHKPAYKITVLRLSQDDARAHVALAFEENARALAKRFPGLEEWPADAQMGIASIAYAAGAYFDFPKLEAALRRSPPDFATAALEGKLRESDNPGVKNRNLDQKAFFEAAARVQSEGLDPDKLWANVATNGTMPPVPPPGQNPENSSGDAGFAGAAGAFVLGLLALLAGRRKR